MHSTPRRISLAVTASVVAALAASGVAHAVTIGSDLSVAPTLGLGTNHTGTTLTASPGALNPLTSPIGGVLVRIRLRYGQTDANPGTVGFRILGGTNPFTARPATVDGGELRFPLLASLPAGSDDYVDYSPVDSNGRPIGIPIAAGERLGVAQAAPGLARIIAPLTGASIAFTSGQQLSGSASYTVLADLEFTVQGVVEPDADGDHRGDLTQDECPALANDPTTGRCPPQLVTREVTREVQIEVQKCHVPLLRGLTRGLATRLLNAAGCRVGTVGRRTVRRGRPGRVIAQSVSAGTVASFGTKVGITLSKRRAVSHRR
jgi:hypothetical protein